MASLRHGPPAIVWYEHDAAGKRQDARSPHRSRHIAKDAGHGAPPVQATSARLNRDARWEALFSVEEGYFKD